MRKLLVALLLLLACCGIASAQGTAYRIGPYPSDALVYVCPYPDGGTPCPSPSTIYVNPTLTIQQPNPFVLRAGSNFTFYLGSGQYTVQVPSLGRNDIVGIGLTPNVTNIFTAPQYFDANVAMKGPNPWADVSRFGGYFGPANPGTFTTGAITSGTPALVLANVQDFANGQGILVLGAGPASSLGTPTGVQVAPWGVTGSTTYNYCVVAEDYLGGRTACSPAGASTTSAATLGINTATLASCNRAAGIVTCTTTGNHNFTAGAQVNIVKNSTGDATHGFEGVFSILTTPTATTFTYTQYGALDVSGTVTTGTAQVNATNLVKWQSDASNTVLRWYVYRCTASCGAIGPNYAFAGTAIGVDGYFQDYGLATNVAVYGNGDVPATAPTTASNTWLSTTILSGGGTTSLTLANNASTTVAGAKVLHDNTPNLVAACNSLPRGGITYIPNSNVFANWFPINSPFKLASCPASTQIQVGNKVWANAPIVMVAYQNIQGLPSSSYGLPAFYYIRPAATIAGFGFPLIYTSPLVGNNLSLDDLVLLCDQAYQPCIFQDQNTTGGSLTGARYRNVHTNGGSGVNTTWVVKGGFGHFWEYGGWSNSASSFASPPAMLFSPNCGLGNAGQQIAGLVSTEYTYGFGGTAFDACNQGTPLGMSYISFRDMITESPRGPMFRFANTGAIGTPSGNIAFWEIVRPDFADPLTGQATPLIDATMAQQITGLHLVSPSTSGSPLIESNSGGVTGVDVSADYTGIVGAQYYTSSGAGTFYNYPAKASGALGHFAYQMAVPSPPQSAVVSAGGAVPVGAHTYTVAAVDFSGNETTISTGVTATTTGGNQTVTVTLPATFPAGAKGVNVYRDGARANNGACGANPQFTTPGGTYVDTFASNCGQSPSSVNNAGAPIMDANGVASPKFFSTIGSTVDFSRATTFLPPSSAGFISSSIAQFGYDTTLTNWKGWAGYDAIFPTIAVSATPVTGDVATLVNSGGTITLSNNASVGLGTNFLKCDGVPSANNGDIFKINGSGHCATATPGIPGRVVTNSGTLSGADLVSCTSGTGDRGSTIIFTNAAAVTETLPNPATGACGSNFNVRLYWQGAAGGTLKATTATLNGVAGSTGIAIPTNTWLDAISHDNINYDVYISGSGGGGSSAFPLTVSGTVTSGGIPYFNSTTQESSSALLTTNIYIKGGGAGNPPIPGLTTDDGTTSTYTGTGGTKSPVFTSTGSTAWFAAFTQGSTSAAVAPCNGANTACFQAPAAVTSYVANVPAAAPANNNSAMVFSNSNPSVGTFAKIPQIAVLSSAYTNATTSATNVTGLSFSLEASTTYTLSCHLIYQAAATGGLNINFTGSAAPTKVTYGLNYFTTATAANSSATTGSTFATVVGGTVIGTAATDFTADLNGAIINGVNAGTLQLQAKSNAAVTLTIEAGSSCTLQ